jgi:hypothetical protein
MLLIDFLQHGFDLSDPAAAADDIRHVLSRPPPATPDGRTLLDLTPLEFLAALAREIPPPRVQRHRYDGVLSPNAALRGRVTARATASAPDTPPGTDARMPHPPTTALTHLSRTGILFGGTGPP